MLATTFFPLTSFREISPKFAINIARRMLPSIVPTGIAMELGEVVSDAYMRLDITKACVAFIAL